MALDHNAVVTELWRRINEALTIPLQTAATAASDALLAQIAAEAARDGTAAMLETKADKSHKHTSADITDAVSAAALTGTRANKVVKTGSDGMLHSDAYPRENTHLVHKGFLDSEVGKKADKAHTHKTDDITDLLKQTALPTANTLAARDAGGRLNATEPIHPTHLTTKKYVDDSRVLNQVYEAYRTETPIEITGSGPIFPFPQGLGGNLTITAIVNTTEEYYNARDVHAGSRTLWLVRLRDRYGNVLNGSDHGHAIVGATWTSGGIGGANYYRYMTPPVGENVELSCTFDLQPGYYIDAIAIRKWDSQGIVGHSLTAVKVESHPDPEDAINALPGHDYVDRVRDELGEQIEDIESGLGDHIHLSEDIADAVVRTETQFAGRVPVVAATGNIQSKHDPADNQDYTRKYWVDGRLSGKADTGHTHTVAQVTGLQSSLNDKLDSSEAIVHLGATSYGKVIRRESDSDAIRTGDPTAWYHAANKKYVDNQVAEKANTSHTHTSSDVTDAANGYTLTSVATNAGRLVEVSGNGTLEVHPANLTNGNAHAVTNKKYVDEEVAQKADVSHTHTLEDISGVPKSSSPSAVANTIVTRNTSGHFSVAEPTSDSHAASRGYVDDNVPWIGSPYDYSTMTKSPGRLYVIVAP